MHCEQTALLAELMLHADVFCGRIEEAAGRLPHESRCDELRLKISQVRGALATLQSLHDDDQLKLENPTVRATFRHLIMGLLWTVHLAGPLVDFKNFRRLVQIESGFTYLLIQERGDRPAL